MQCLIYTNGQFYKKKNNKADAGGGLQPGVMPGGGLRAPGELSTLKTLGLVLFLYPVQSACYQVNCVFFLPTSPDYGGSRFISLKGSSWVVDGPSRLQASPLATNPTFLTKLLG